MKIVVTEEQLKGIINSNVLKETAGELDKYYVRTGIFDDEDRNIIMSITGGDNWTKLIADMYKYFVNKYNPLVDEPRKINDNEIQLLRDTHTRLMKIGRASCRERV